MNKSKFSRFPAILTVSVLCAGTAVAHALPEQDVPGAGAILQQPPSTVSIRFDAELEPIFSKLIVKNGQDKQVSEGKGNVDTANRKILSTRLVNAGKGSYHVYWSVVSRDGHRTEGDYTFTVR
jgi:copper resistance protein C